MISSTHVLDFPAVDGANPDQPKLGEPGSAVPAFKILVEPDNITPGQPFQVRVLAGQQFRIGWVHGAQPIYSTAPGGDLEEVVDLSGELETAASAPISRLLSAKSETGLITDSGALYRAALQDLAGFSVRLGRLVAPRELWGSVRIRYQTPSAQIWGFPEGLPRAGQYWGLFSSAILPKPEKFVVDVQPGQGSNGPAVVTIQARDFCTDLPIAGAEVHVNGNFVGTTDADGLLPAGLLPAGAHNVYIQAPGYRPADGADIRNNSFEL